jgi:hypothetical protein
MTIPLLSPVKGGVLVRFEEAVNTFGWCAKTSTVGATIPAQPSSAAITSLMDGRIELG